MRNCAFLSGCLAVGSMLASPVLASAEPPVQAAAPVAVRTPSPPSSTGPRLVGHGSVLTAAERASYEAKAAACPEVLTIALVGGTASDGEVILIAVVVALVVVLIIVLI